MYVCAHIINTHILVWMCRIVIIHEAVSRISNLISGKIDNLFKTWKKLGTRKVRLVVQNL